jgi:hypothetical protein
VKVLSLIFIVTLHYCFTIRFYVFSVGPDVFANNRLSLTLVDSPSADLLLLMTGVVQEGSIALPDAIKDPQFGHSNEPSKSALMYFHKDKGVEGTLFSYLEQNVSPQP